MQKKVNLQTAIWKKILFLIVAALLVNTVFSRTDYQSFYQQSEKINNIGMYTLGSWAILNMVSGGYGWTQSSGDNKYFHQMNLFWNTVNLSIAVFALTNSGNISEMSSDEMMNNHLKTERLYLLNAGLDVLYIGTGILLKQLSASKTKNKAILNGYGNSIVLQGSFLMAFDAVMYFVQHSRRIQFLENTNAKLSFGFNSLNVVFTF